MVEQTEAIRILLQFEADQAEKRAKSMERQLASLERRFDPLGRATKRYEQGQRTLERSLEAGTIDVARYEAGLENLNREYDQARIKAQQAGTAVANFNKPISGLGGFMQRNRSAFQQAGFQVGDFAVQVQGGTSAVTAFTQQGSQLLGVFGAYGALAGAALAIGAPLAASLFSVGEAGGDAEDRLKGFNTILNEAIGLAELAATPIDDLRERFGEFAEEVRRGAQIAAQAALSSALREFGEISADFGVGLDDVRSKVADLQRAYDDLATVEEALGERTLRNKSAFEEAEQAVEAAASAMDSAAASLGLTATEAIKVDDALKALSSAEGMEAIAEQASNVSDLFGEIFNESENIPPEVAEILAELQRVLEAASAGVKAFDDMGDAAGGAADEAGRLAFNLQSALNLSASVAAGRIEQGVRSGALPPQAINDASVQSAVTDRSLENIVSDRRDRGRAAGRRQRSRGGRVDREAQELQRNAERILSSLKTAQDRYNESVAEADALLQAGALTQEQYNLHLENLGVKLENAEFDQVISEIRSMSDELANAILTGESLADAFSNMLSRMAADLLSSGLEDGLRSIFGLRPSGGGSGLGGGLGDLFGLFSGGPLLSFNGGGFTGTGSRSGGVDGIGGFPAILHPNELVTDLSRGQSVGRTVVEIIAHTDPSTIMEIADRSAEQKSQAVLRQVPGIARGQMRANDASRL